MSHTRAIPVQASVVVTRGSLETEPFTRSLVDLADQGLRTLCSDPASHHLWLSAEVTERRIAVELCRGRPVIRPCAATAEARRERFGVWGGVDRSPRPKTAKADRRCGSHHPNSLVTWQPRCCSAPSAAAPRGMSVLARAGQARDKVHAAARNDHRRTQFADLPVADLSPRTGRKPPADSVWCLGGAAFVGSQHR
jgi:Transcription factor WhiB